MKNRLLKKVTKFFLAALSINFLLLSFSQSTFALVEVDEINDLPECIDLTNEDDADRIVTIIEEALPMDETSMIGDTEIRRCYRHTIEDLNTHQIVAKLSSEEGKCRTDYLDGSEDYRYACYEVQVLLSGGGTSLIYGYIGMIYEWGATMAGIIAVLIIVLSGIQISASGGDSEAIESAKKRILKSFAGIAVLFLSGLILYTINPTFFTNG